MEIIKLIPINFLCPYQTLLDWQFCYFTKGSQFGYLVNSDGYSKKHKVQHTKNVTKNRARVNFLISESIYMIS